MPQNPLAAHDSHSLTDSLEEQFDAVVELADAIRDLTDQFDQIQQTLDIYESKLLHTDPELLKLHQQPDSNNLKRWQGFIERVSQELNTLMPPV
ncbi:MAG: hypothetical protein KME07_20500 [Pegethrix bostrychoides GSE-TBD4-15B]|jgi:hypothetical protein|uniref:Uncharacterized protein n=1 Tax=Pegethrix bostrychoides GSE-TBD4-15B TaxID=2839662 RepID=A0A951PDS3_9CYAN|nr:hypothetical protein [Pegethrix bostrychoides GSE-TBD4-15B]